ncbi:hypothetical protein IQ264_06930 [Phormidium sp. LEGE 05292]|uniref:hypothetical protein n=1 Tax=[Phormidium] sp. LEGE 05292 TaxID=767427 RepID=UPI00187E880F|nr:hypothetical protein [Phormidium sp. LEGE 05292]MBE9225165.1 hypothetical protein [Phormidium sp. LEGE 05292]
MAELPEEALNIAFNLEKRLLQITYQASNLGFRIWEEFGETNATIADLDLLQNVTEQARANYTKLTKQLFEIAASRSKSNLMTIDSLFHYCHSIETNISGLELTIAQVKSNQQL